MFTADTFFIIFLATIVTTRIFLYFSRLSSPTILGLRINHYMYGLILAALGFAFKSLPLYAIGIGLVVDQLMLLFIRTQTWEDYFSLPFLTGTAVFVIIAFLLRHSLIPW